MGLGKKSMYTSFMAAKSFMSAKYTLYLTTLSKLEPASSRTSLRFCNTVLCMDRQSFMWLCKKVRSIEHRIVKASWSEKYY